MHALADVLRPGAPLLLFDLDETTRAFDPSYRH